MINTISKKTLPGLLMGSFLLAAATPAARAQLYVYDDGGRLVRVAYPEGGGIAYSYDAADNMTAAQPLSLPAAPAAPDVTQPSPTTANISWQSVTGATGYVIERRRADDSAWEELATVSASANAFVDTAVEEGVEYVYRVSAVGSDGRSVPSEETGLQGLLPRIAATTNGASFREAVSPGAIATVFGTDLADEEILAATIPLPRTLAGAEVLVGGFTAPLYYVSPLQINFQVPFEAPIGVAVPVQVIRNGVAGPESFMLIRENNFGAFLYDRSGIIDPIIVHGDGALVTPANPAQTGEFLVVYGTGTGGIQNPPQTGAASVADPLAVSRTLPEAILSGNSGAVPVPVQFLGMTPDFVGLAQLNIQIPATPPPGAALQLGIRFSAEEEYLFVPIYVAQE
jgi:uncharacterized protein (TIGR03437 family)